MIMSLKKIKISILGLLLLIVLIFLFAVKPLLNDIRSNSEQLRLSEENLTATESKISNLESFRIVYKGLEDFLEQVDDLFISADVPIDFINFLEENARDMNLEIKIMPNVIKSGKAGAWSNLVFQVSVKGSFNNLSTFLRKIENGVYLIEVNDLSVSRTEENVSASFSLKVFAK
jgi:Tfp pilus assembly protein PilO